MARRTVIMKIPYQDREVEWEYDECKNCGTEICRNRYVVAEGAHPHTFSTWLHKPSMLRSCTWLAEPKEDYENPSAPTT